MLVVALTIARVGAQESGAPSPGSSGGLRIAAASLELQADNEPQPKGRAVRSKPEPWIKKHPAKFGALVGAGIGAAPAIYAMSTCPPTRSCSTAGVGVLFGATMGAGIGAVTGWITSRAFK